MNETHHNSYHLIGIWALQAMVRAKQGKEAEAATILERALTLAGPGGFIFPFIELGLSMTEMLKHLRKQGVAKDFIKLILAEVETVRQLVLRQEMSGRQTGSSETAKNGLLIEGLTTRELEILTQVAEGLSNTEIGAKLFLSSLTVKKHLSNIYQKLGVRKRLEAVNRARELGILPRE
ncbi:MAG: LuxR C-terminal-related transcriptional regulator, partial [Deltaproteobacteria bacterium]